MSQFIEMYYNTHNKQTLESVCPIMSKGITPKYVESSSVLVINQACIHWDGQRLGNIKYHNEEIPVRKRILESGDVLLNATGNGTLGRCCVFICPSDNNTYINDGHVIALSTDRAVILPEVLNTYLSLNDTQAEIYRQYVTGSTNQVDIVFSDIKKMKVPVPSMDEQILFVEVLKQADKSKFGDFKSQFIEMFGNQNTNDKGWTESLVKDEFKLSMGKTPARNNPECWDNGTHKWVSISDMSSYTRYTGDTSEYITDYAIADSGIKAVPKGTIIMSFKLSIGRTAITSEDLYTNEAIMAFAGFDEKKFNIDFLHFLIANKNWLLGAKQAVKGQTLNKESIGNAKIIIPPIEAQEEFASIYNQADKSKSVIQKALVYLNDIQSDELGKIA